MKINQVITEGQQNCPECGGPAFSDLLLAEKKDACYNKVRSRYKVWPSAYASGALVQCRKKGAANWGNKSKNEDVAEGLGKDLKRLATGKDAKSRAGQEIAKAQQASMTGDNKTAHKHFKRYDKLDKLANKEQGVAEDQINESPTIDFIRGLISEFNKEMSGSPYYPMDYKNPGMRMWTRGDGSKYKDPGYIFIDRDLKPEDIPKWHKAGAVEKFWKFLESKGARKIGDVSGEFGSDPHSPAVVLNKLIFVFNGRSIAWGSTSRLKNSSVWRQKQQGVAEGYEPGDKITWYYSNHYPEIEGTVVGWKDGHLIVKSIDPSPRNTEKTVAKYRVPKNNILSHSKQGVAEGMLDNPGQEDSPVAQAIIRRILMQRTDLLAKHGPEKVGQAVDEVADFVGDVDEIGSSDVSGWVRHVEQTLGNMNEGDISQLEKDVADAPVEPIANMESATDSDGYTVDYEDAGEYDYEGDQAKDQLQTIVAAARKLDGILDDNENMPEWVQMKITKATDYLDTAADYVAANKAQAEPMAEANKDKIGGLYDPQDFDDMVLRLKKLAGAGPMKTVWDPQKRVYKNVPVAVQPPSKK